MIKLERWIMLLLIVTPNVAFCESLCDSSTNKVVVGPIISHEYVPIAEVWRNPDTHKIHERSLVAFLAQHKRSEITDLLDSEISDRFESTASGKNALYLGLCHSERSRQLLVNSQNHPNPIIEENVRLALARRGDTACAQQFIKRYNEHAISHKLSVELARDNEAIKVIRKLEYIGSTAAIMALFDGATSNVLANTTSNPRGVIVLSNAMKNLHEFLNDVGINVPETVSNEHELARWWNANRKRIASLLHKKENMLPRLNQTRIVICHF